MKEKAPVEGTYASGKVAEREEEEILLLKLAKSLPERRPRIWVVAEGRLKVRVPAAEVMPQSLLMAVEEVAKVMAEAVVVPAPPMPRAVKPPSEAAERQVVPMA